MADTHGKLVFNIPAGRNVTAATAEDGTVYLRIDTKGTTWNSNGPKKSLMAASTEGFVNINGFKIGMNVLAPKV